MSKTIECCSIHKDTINLTTKAGDQRAVVFEDKGGVGFAMIDEDEAEILLSGIGAPEYWKAGSGLIDMEALIAADPEASEAAAKITGRKKKGE